MLTEIKTTHVSESAMDSFDIVTGEGDTVIRLSRPHAALSLALLEAIQTAMPVHSQAIELLLPTKTKVVDEPSESDEPTYRVVDFTLHMDLGGEDYTFKCYLVDDSLRSYTVPNLKSLNTVKSDEGYHLEAVFNGGSLTWNHTTQVFE